MGRTLRGQKRKSPFVRRIVVLMTLVGLLSSVLCVSSSAVLARMQQGPVQTIAINGSQQWAHDKIVTTLTNDDALTISTTLESSPLFKLYYQSHSQSLGAAITVAFPSALGWIQFFQAGALLLPLTQPDYFHTGNDALHTLIKDGIRDPATGIVQLSLLKYLLDNGSQAPIVSVSSGITYVHLRSAALPEFMQPAPTGSGASSSASLEDVFVKGGTRAGKSVGHVIPASLWRYITSPAVSPDRWSEDIGLPLTEALPFTVMLADKLHHMQVQVFAHAGFVLDQDARDAAGQPLIHPLAVGEDYARTFGLPVPAIQDQQLAWSVQQTTLLDAPASLQVLAQIGPHFPLSLLGESRWLDGMLWYHVQWSVPKGSRSGWIRATDSTFTSPGEVPSWASVDALSPQLASYLHPFGADVGVVLYDMTHQRYYTYNSDTTFLVASSIKVPIMVTFFDLLEQQGREPTGDEMDLLTTMIENSNNDSASALYDEVGDSAGVSAYFQKIAISGLSPQDGTWGYSVITPQAMVDLLALLYEGKILNANHRSMALNLMENIESDQQVGVGDTAPAGTIVAMKDGWVPGPDDLWAVNTSGIVTSGQETYSISVYTQEQQDLESGQAIVSQVCSLVAAQLL